jgi:hypothetical protein
LELPDTFYLDESGSGLFSEVGSGSGPNRSGSATLQVSFLSSLSAIMPKVKAKSTVALDDDGCDSGERLAAPRVIGKSKRGARWRSPVLRTIGTRSRPLSWAQLTVFGAADSLISSYVLLKILAP